MIDKKFIDYDGPTGLYVATGEKVVPLESAEGISAVAQSAMLTSLGSSPEAKQYEAAMHQSLAAAHDVDLVKQAVLA
jgi:hypothetical protein